MAKIGSFFLAIFMFSVISFAQEITVNLEVSSDVVSLGDFVEINVIVEADRNAQIEEPNMPNFADLSLQGQSKQTSDQVSIINGEYKYVRSYRFQYTYRTETKGEIDIPPIPVNVSNKTYRTDGFKLRVLDKGQASNTIQNRPQKGQQRQVRDPFEEMEERFRNLLQRRNVQPSQIKPINPDEAFSIRLEVDKTRAYIGEQITASYYLYIPDDVVLRNIDTLKFPSLNRFWKEDIEISTRLNFEPVIINGRPFNRALLASYALFPIQSGTSTVDSYKAKCSVASRSVFGFGRNYTYTKASDEQIIDVLPLPNQNRPQDFAGAVGDFNIQAKVEDKNIQQGQAFSLKIKIEGRGNAKSIERPRLDLPDNISLQSESEETRFFSNGQSFKEFTLYLTPLEAGELEIPSMTFHYFDPSSVAYKSKSTQKIYLNAKKGVVNTVASARSDFSVTEDNAALELPQLYTTYYEGSILNQRAWLYLIFALFTLSSLNFLRILFRDCFTTNQKKVFLKKVEYRQKLLNSLKSPDNAKKYAIESLNFIYFLLGENLREKHSSEKLSKLIEVLPLSIKKDVAESILKISNDLQVLAFAPTSMASSISTKEGLKKLQKEMASISKVLIKYRLSYLESE